MLTAMVPSVIVKEFGQNLVITRTDNICSSSWLSSPMYDIESLMSTSNNCSCLNNFPLYVCGERANPLKKNRHFILHDFLSITDIDRQ